MTAPSSTLPSGGAAATAGKRLAVVGLGKLGAPMAAVLAAKGFRVVAVDVNADHVAALNAGRAPVQEPRLQEMIDAGRERLSATLDFNEAIIESEASFVIVPTPSGPDHAFSNKYVLQAVEKIGHALRGRAGYHLVVITSTVMPGATGGVIREALEVASGRHLGPDLGLCYSPEFIALGSVVTDMLRPDMTLIGQSDARAGDLLASIYAATVETRPEVHRMNFVNAELCKISVNTFVTTKISYANMIAEMCDHLAGADADVVTRAIGADSRIGRKYLRGALGYGGPCFPRDNKAFAALGRSLGARCDLAEATDRINDHQVWRLFGAVEARVAAGATVAILGLSYKPHTAVIDESQGVGLARLLLERGYRVVISDPLAAENGLRVLGAAVEALPAGEAVARADAVVVATPWPEFKELPAEAFVRAGGNVVVIDPWRMIDPARLGPSATLIVPGREAAIKPL